MKSINRVIIEIMKKLYLLLSVFLAVILSAQSECVVLERLSGTYVGLPNNIAKQVKEFEEIMPAGYRTTFFNHERTNAFISCKSDWYHYNDTMGWVNDYKLDNHGFTCNPMLFFEDGQPHILGGYGIWRGQTLNIYFSDAEWQSVKGKHVPENYNPSLGFYNGDSAYVLIGGRYENSFIGLDESTEDCFLVSKKGDWKKITLPEFPFVQDLDHDYYRLITDDYIVSYSRSNGIPHVFIQDLESYNITYSEFNFSPMGKDIVSLTGDTLSVITEGGIIYKFDIEKLLNQGSMVDMTIHNPSWNYGLVLLLPIIAIIFLFLRRFNKKIGKDNKPKYYDRLVFYELQNLSVEELDQLFELNSLGYDATRKRRSELIKTINMYHKNLTGKELILREKDPQDKRRVIYKISQEEKSSN